MFRTVSDQVSLWEAVLPPELLRLPDELSRVDELLDDPVFFTPFAAYFDARINRSSSTCRGPVTVMAQPRAASSCAIALPMPPVAPAGQQNASTLKSHPLPPSSCARSSTDGGWTASSKPPTNIYSSASASLFVKFAKSLTR